MPQFEERPAWRVAAVLVLCAPLCACRQEVQQLDGPALARQLHALSSVSAEGAFVASELRAGHLTPSFASVHLRDLAQDAEQGRRELARPAQPDLERRRAAAQMLAQQLAEALRTTATARGGPDGRLASGQKTFGRLKSGFDAPGNNP